MMRICGTKQVLKALDSSKVLKVFLADDVDEYLRKKITSACRFHQVEIQSVPSMEELGKMCGIAVPSATAADICD